MTTTSYALLGLLGLRKWSTYELAKQVERSLGWFWPRTERKLYDQAKRLVEEGLATASSAGTGARPRTLYGITPKGRKALRAWLNEPSAPPKLESEAQVRVFFADAGDLDQLQSTLTQIGEQARDQLDNLHNLIAASEAPDYEYAKRTHLNAISFRFQLDYHQMTAQWADWALQQTRRWVAVDDPGSWDWKREIKRSG
jgi:DNA-binding PadR family transcriptional regulator